jgi:hypothetical protein
MARRPKNPINDIVDTVGGWLGGRGPGTNPQVRAAMDATRAVGKVVDTATGGFGSALISDAQRMAQSGSSTPSALYKTAAVNLGAAAAGVGAAKVAGKLVGGVSAKTGIHLSDVPNLKNITYSGQRAGKGFGEDFGSKVQEGATYKFSPFTGKSVSESGKVAKADRFTTKEFSKIVAKQNVGMAEKTGRSTAGYGYITKSRLGDFDPDYGVWSEARTTGRQRVVQQVSLPRVSASSSIAQKQANVDAVSKALSDAFERQAKAQKVVTGLVVGASVQQGGLKKARGGGKNKK